MVDKSSVVSGCLKRYPHLTLCLKQPVYVLLLTAKFKHFYGMNHINISDLAECPRKDFPTGQGYELCQNICHQGAHAEMNAINNALEAGVNLHGSKVFIVGHDYCCEPCLRYMYQHGIQSAYCIDTPKLYEF